MEKKIIRIRKIEQVTHNVRRFTLDPADREYSLFRDRPRR